MGKKIFPCFLILFFFSCKCKEYSLDFIFLWKENSLRKFKTISHLGIEKKKDEFWANSGEISCLENKQNEKISIKLKLEKDPFFLFYPLTKINDNQSVQYEVSIFRENKLEKTYRYDLKYNIPPAPQRVLVDLRIFENKEITISLSGSIKGENKNNILWGSPFIIQKTKNKIDKNKNLNFLLISIDTLRADALGIYGKKPSITPNIDNFSKNSDIWMNCYSTSNKTNPSFCSILSGLYSKHHGIYTLVDPLSLNILTLAEIFKKNGYETIAVVSAFHLHSGANLCRRFSKYKVSNEIFSPEEAIFESIYYLKNTKKPFFLWLHIFDPHTPHTAPEPFFSGYYATRKFDYFPFNFFNKNRKNSHLNYIDYGVLANPEMYYDEVAYMDFSLGFLFNFLEENRHFKNTVVAFISDHGENLNEHGNISDHGGLWETTTHIPLILKIPEKKKCERFEYFVQSIDLFPTILRFFNFKIYQNDGMDLYPEYNPKKREFIFAEALEENEIMARSKKYLFKIKRKDNFIETFLFEPLKDPKEVLNISVEKKEIIDKYIKILNLFLKDRIIVKSTKTLSEEDIKKFKSLGYIY